MTDHLNAPKNPNPERDKPTAKQLRFVKQLALQRGITFTPPATKRDASRLIVELLTRKPDSAADRYREARALDRDLATRRGDNARVRDHELEGHGSSATWSQRS